MGPIDHIDKRIQLLSEYVNERRQELIKNVIADRTRHVTIVLEDLFQKHNASAALRTAECVGVQDIHVVEKTHTFGIAAGIAMGASKWLDIHRHKSIEHAYNNLRENGYTIVATMPHERGVTLPELPIDKKIALVFGTENFGLSDYAIKHADQYVTIPMVGFTESFNVSVSIAIALYDIMQRLRNSDVPWRLSACDQQILLLEWLRKSVRAAKQLEERYINQQ